MENNFIIRVWSEGNAGNILAMYLTAIKLRQTLKYGKIYHVNIPLFDIKCEDIDLNDFSGGFHDRFHSNGKRYGVVPMNGLARLIKKSDASFISLEGLSQNIKNFPDRNSFEYDKYFPFLSSSNDGGGIDDLVINIRGGDILGGISPLYPMLPIEFYKFLELKTKKRIIFCGQLDQSLYMEKLKNAFPNAIFRPSQGIEKDFDFIRRSKHIVPCLSTFSWFASWMSHAERIYFPVAALFNPAQHYYGNMLPLDDPRYEFYLFPIYDALSIDHYEEYITPVKNSWKYITSDELGICTRGRTSNIDNYLLAFDTFDYLNMHPENKPIFEEWGVKGIVNHYMDTGFLNKQAPCYVDRSFYTRNYPLAAIEISDGLFENEVEHYVMRGQFQGYWPHEKKRTFF